MHSFLSLKTAVNTHQADSFRVRLPKEEGTFAPWSNTSVTERWTVFPLPWNRINRHKSFVGIELQCLQILPSACCTSHRCLPVRKYIKVPQFLWISLVIIILWEQLDADTALLINNFVVNEEYIWSTSAYWKTYFELVYLKFYVVSVSG